MKALCIKEPWAGMIRTGIKTIETRTWKTKYRGLLLLCASKKPKTELSGNAFAVTRIKRCRPMKEKDELAAQCDIYPRAQAWELGPVIPIKPFPVLGKQSFFEVSMGELDEAFYRRMIFKLEDEQ